MTGRWVAALCGALVVCAPVVTAQTTKITLGGCSCAMGNNTLAEYVAGEKVSATAVTYTVAMSGPNTTTRTTAVYVRANAATMTNGKPVGECEWQKTGSGTWTALTTTDVFIESQVITAASKTWNNGISLRCSLDWVNDPVAAQSVTLTFTLQVTP
jgi:hypothetical protein